MGRSDKSLVSLFGGARKRKNHAKRGRVMVFGVFDGLHGGHRAFLRAAKKRGTELIVVIARDEVVRLLKNKTPRFSEGARGRAIRVSGLADRVVLGDEKQGTYSMISRYAPDIICLGYDQKALAADVQMRIRTHALPRMHIVRLRPHRPDRLKSSLLP